MEIKQYVDTLPQFNALLQYISIIPECIAHDSSEEKLWSKASDIVLSTAFERLGLKSNVLHTRSDSADVIAKSIFHGYTLVADAKAFRLSRTAKNQKDFKVTSLSQWRQDSDYAILCSPYFQYPPNKSQIYKQAIENNVCLLGWEHLLFLLQNNIRENNKISFSHIWEFSYSYGKNIIYANLKDCFLSEFNSFLCHLYNKDVKIFKELLNEQIAALQIRGESEISYWESEIDNILNYSREQAIKELIKCKKINQKLDQIKLFIKSLKNEI